MYYQKSSLPKQILCPRLNKAKLACIQKTCQQPNFMCTHDSCQSCVSAHLNCKLTNAHNLLQKIKQKENRLTPEITKAMHRMEDIYQQQIQRLFQDKQSMMIQMDYFGLNEYQAQLFKIIDQGRFSEITGKKIMCNVVQHMFEKQQFGATEEIVKKKWKKRKEQLDCLLLKFKKLQQVGMIPIQSNITDDSQTLNSFFNQNFRLKDFKLLFRASQHNFSARQFHKLCDGKANTVVLIQTEFNKIIGGFTPLPWHSNGQYSHDYKRQSFLFSITQKMKFQIVSANQAIYGQNSYGPTFGGGHDIYIADRRGNRRNYNQQQQRDQEDDQGQDEGSYFNFPSSYLAPNYQQKPSINGKGLFSKKVRRDPNYQFFTGQTNGDYYCEVKQYEVFQVTFLD